ncbi:type IV secretion protein Dot [Legionella spiritensis]|uniref:type IV secretion protein Dot n=1 Tax=Legionella spiritensis TaxID=452 RepID=UPI000F6EEB3F|nr:type IV secretion protein Dot [Legionella spiritensis]VEG91602.1 Dot/Icm T4SS effector [Legionella spiritensis]
MNTLEHTEVGNHLRIDLSEHNNPYLYYGEQGEIRVRLMRFDQTLPEPMDIELSTGEIVAMAGDYYTSYQWDMKLNLPPCHDFDSTEALGRHLIRQPVLPEEQNALMDAYNNLAAPDVRRKDIDKIYTISQASYIPFSTTLNDYTRQLMIYLRVKNYGELLNRNQTHFTPWSVRVYTLGHHLALNATRIAYELYQLAENGDYQPQHEEIRGIWKQLECAHSPLTSEIIRDLAHRYHALAVGIECFTFHYFSDHFAAGHMAMMGDLRVLLPQRFGTTMGGILANNFHNELNRIGVNTKRIYDPTPDKNAPTTPATGDDDFDICRNYFNKKACIAGMQCSLQDLERVLNGEDIPEPQQYGGLEYLPDLDDNIRQPKPLFVPGDHGEIYVRNPLNRIPVISPSELDAIRANPKACGYKEVRNKLSAFKLVAQLRLLPFIFEGKEQPLTADERIRIEEDELQRNPHRKPLPTPPCETTPGESETIIDWRKSASPNPHRYGLASHGMYPSRSEKPVMDNETVVESASNRL